MRLSRALNSFSSFVLKKKKHLLIDYLNYNYCDSTVSYDSFPNTKMTRTKQAHKSQCRPASTGMKLPRVVVRKTAPAPNTPRFHRLHPGTRARFEILQLQRTTAHLIRKLPFEHLVREIAQGFKSDVRFQPDSILALQEASEAYLSPLFEDSNLFARHAKSVTITIKNMSFARRISGELAQSKSYYLNKFCLLFSLLSNGNYSNLQQIFGRSIRVKIKLLILDTNP